MSRSTAFLVGVFVSGTCFAQCDAVGAFSGQYGMSAVPLGTPPGSPPAEVLAGVYPVVVQRLDRERTLYVDVKSGQAWLRLAVSGMYTFYGPLPVDRDKLSGCARPGG